MLRTRAEAEKAVSAMCEPFAWCRLNNPNSVECDGEFDSESLRKLADILDSIER